MSRMNQASNDGDSSDDDLADMPKPRYDNVSQTNSSGSTPLSVDGGLVPDSRPKDNLEGTRVLFQPIRDALADHQRVARIFEEINPGITQNENLSIDGDQANDSQIADGLIDLYRKHRRIVLEPNVPGHVVISPINTSSVAFSKPNDALRRGSDASDAFLFQSDTEIEAQMSRLLDFYLYQENGYSKSLEVTIGLLYVEKWLQPQDILDAYLEKNVILAVFQAYRIKMPISPNILRGFLFLNQIGRLEKVLADGVRQFLRQDQVDDNVLVPQDEFLSMSASFLPNQQPTLNENQQLHPQGFVLGLDCSDIAGKLSDSRQTAKLQMLSQYIDGVKKTGLFQITPSVLEELNKDRTAGSRVARVIAMVLTNAALVLMCLIGLGVGLFCWQKRRTGHTGWFFTETNTLKNLRIAQTAIARATARMA